eukprot:COSAG06_NODE_2324_length_7083_cov_6.158648_3_plen_114_part_00
MLQRVIGHARQQVAAARPERLRQRVLGLRLGQRRLLPRQLGQLGIQAAAQLAWLCASSTFCLSSTTRRMLRMGAGCGTAARRACSDSAAAAAAGRAGYEWVSSRGEGITVYSI